MEAVGVDGVSAKDLVTLVGVHADRGEHRVGDLARMRERSARALVGNGRILVATIAIWVVGQMAFR